LLASSIAQMVFCIGRHTPDGVSLLGTGFALGGNKVATTAHVTTHDHNGLVCVLPYSNSLEDYQDTTMKEIKLISASIAAFDPIRDIAILEVAGLHAVLPYALRSSDRVGSGRPIVTLGYPHADFGRHVLTQQASSVGARVLLGSVGGLKTKHIVMNVQTRPGQSGSPVFDVDGASIVAMVIGSFAPGGGGGISIGGIDRAGAWLIN
jgi:S1-C subfamily serine protease